MTFAPVAPLTAVEQVVPTHPTSQPQSDPINMGTQDPKKENL